MQVYCRTHHGAEEMAQSDYNLQERMKQQAREREGKKQTEWENMSL